jgi:hypothetical protein
MTESRCVQAWQQAPLLCAIPTWSRARVWVLSPAQRVEAVKQTSSSNGNVYQNLQPSDVSWPKADRRGVSVVRF